MEIYNNQTYNTVLIQNENKMLVVGRAWSGDYISIETSPYKEKIITFEIPKEDENTLEGKIYSIFSKCIHGFISHYQELGFTVNTLKINQAHKKIEILTSTQRCNDITIEEQENAVIITITNKANNIQNNRVILDKDGGLSYGYFYLLQDLYYNLVKLTKENTVKLTKKID